MNHKRLIIIVILLFAVFGFFYFGVVRRILVLEYDAASEGFVRRDDKPKNIAPEAIAEPAKNTGSNISAIEEKRPVAEEEKAAEEILKDEVEPESAREHQEEAPVNIINYVPFTPQAPFAEWDVEMFQDGCEEAVSLMAIRWVKGEKLDSRQAKNEITAISDYEKEKFGEYRDASAKDTWERIIKGYFGYANAEYRENITAEDIVSALEDGNLVITPMNGQKLGNPYYTPPGPERHMLLIIGHDSGKKEFITNDPGTKRGASYRYSEDRLFNAIRDYATGYHESFPGLAKSMIIIKK